MKICRSFWYVKFIQFFSSFNVLYLFLMHNNWTRSTVVKELLPSIVNLTVVNVRLRSPLRVVSTTVFATVKSTINGGNYIATVLLFLNRSFLSSASLVFFRQCRCSSVWNLCNFIVFYTIFKFLVDLQKHSLFFVF